MSEALEKHWRYTLDSRPRRRCEMVTEARARVEAMRPENNRIEEAISVGIARRYGEHFTEKQKAEISRIVFCALDALPYCSGVIPLTDADLEFAEAFAMTLAAELEQEKIDDGAGG